MKKSIILILGFFLFVSCRLNSDRYEDIANYIEDNRAKMLANSLKGIEALNLLDEQNKFYNQRIDYFKAVILNNIIGKEKYHDEEISYYSIFPENSKNYFFWSKDSIDFQIVTILNKKYKGLKIPIEMMNEYYRSVLR